jgi:hypothetical protein
MATMAQTCQSTECHEARKSSISERLLRLVGVEPLEPVPLEPDGLESVLAFRGLTSFIGLPTSTFVPGLETNSEVAAQAPLPFPAARRLRTRWGFPDRLTGLPERASLAALVLRPSLVFARAENRRSRSR